MTQESVTTVELPQTIPVFPLTGVILLPNVTMPLNIFEPRYLSMVRDAAKSHKLIGMIQPKPRESAATDNTSAPEICDVGCAGYIQALEETEDNRILISVQGVQRFRVLNELNVTTPYRQVHADWAPFERDGNQGMAICKDTRKKLLGMLSDYVAQKGLTADMEAIDKAPDRILVNTLSMIVPFGALEKQALLEAETTEDRNKLLCSLFSMISSAANDSGTSSIH